MRPVATGVGLAVAVLAAWRRAPIVLVLVLGAAVTALVWALSDAA